MRILLLWRGMLLIFVPALLFMNLCCKDDPAANMKGQRNAQLRFHALAVDQDGNPLAGVTFSIVVESIPKDWTFENRGKPHEQTHQTVVTDVNGRFAIDINAHVLYVENAELPGYRHLFAKWSDNGNTGYQITSWGKQLYKSDPDHPAVYVLVKNGVKQVSVLPSRGGFQAHGAQWTANQPAWPINPSLTDVIYKPSSTQPTRQH